MGVRHGPDVHVEIGSIEVREADVGDLDSLEAAVANRLEGTTDYAASVAAAIAQTIHAEVPDGR